jgi:phage-related baseplate assembly protein
MVKLIEFDSATLYNGIIQAMEVMTGEPLYPGDERRLFAEALVQVITAMANQCNIACNGKTLQGAVGEMLDALGERTGAERLPAVPATATFTVTLVDELNNDITIPAGTLITTDGDIFFATDSDLTIAAGSTTGTVQGTCTEAGTIGNGFVAGSIAQMVDIIDNVESIINSATSSGGLDEEADDDFRERIKLSNAAFSTAGPVKAYKYHAQSVDSSIVDVVVDSPSACKVDLYILTDEGLPDNDLLAAVEAACSADDVRPLTDQVTAKKPTAVSYDITMHYYTTAADEADCVATIEGTGGVIDQYVAWQMGKMGRNINPNKLLAMCMAPSEGTGCLRVDITDPETTAIGEMEVAIAGTITVTHEVVTE